MSEPTYIRHHLEKAQGDVAGMPTEWFYGLFVSGYLLLAVAFLVSTAFAGVLAFKVKVPGSLWMFNGLVLAIFYHLVQNVSGFMLGPLSEGVALSVYGVCGWLVAVGFVRMAVHLMRSSKGR